MRSYNFLTGKLKRRIAIVTGVSRLEGIGRAICRELANAEIDIFFTYWRDYDKQMPWNVEANEPELIQDEIRNVGVKCSKLELDLSDEGSSERLFEEVESEMGSPSILVNNATYSTQTDVTSLSAAELDEHYEVNLRATTLLSVEFVRRFQHAQHGRIVNIISGESLGPMSNEIAYAITKGAIETLTYTLSQEIAAKGITLNAVNPGPTDTGWMDDKLKEELIRRFPMKRVGMPKDAANLIGFLVSKEAEWITGQIIHSEGGFVR